ncbi:hypothetical protein AK830_g5775 [Neonectria ditissima]|uniref:Replication factor A protein 3 n=1 Tax=Neonectria ditissima TaxID=78410 RepID=A0A0P7BL19_9HYPO|nr:hypothetical protein AK830_g5775 [Neonectria ditissima]
MAEQLCTPRITASYLDNFVGRVVMLVGKVTQLRGNQATLDSDGTVTVLLDPEAHLANGNTAQIIGKVNPDLSIKVWSSRDLGTSVGTTPPKGQHSPTNSWSSQSQHELSHLATPDRTSPTISPAREPHSAAYSRLDASRPSTADSFSSFSTSSSDLIFTRESTFGSSNTPQLFLSDSPSPATLALPSPPREVQFSTPPDDGSATFRTIPSAQPYDHLHPLSSQVFEPSSSSSTVAYGSSPPPTQPQDDYHLDYPTPSPSARSTGHFPAPFPNNLVRGSGPLTPELDESELFDSVLDGIARIHVTMEPDEAGRWRIRRTGDGRL